MLAPGPEKQDPKQKEDASFISIEVKRRKLVRTKSKRKLESFLT